MHWLLALGDHAEELRRLSDDAFKRGRDYKEIKGETFVGELDYGLARIAAEDGQFNDAYFYFTSAFSAYCAPGNYFEESPSSYYFSYIGDAIWRRMKEYVEHVRAFHKDPSKLHDKVPATPRVRDAVLAFVLNDFGEASYSKYLRTGDDQLRDHARSLYQEAIDHSPDYAMPHFNLYLLEEQDRYTVSPQGDEEQIKQLMDDALAQKPFNDDKEGHIERVIQLQPEWQVANQAMLSKHCTGARREREAARRLERIARRLERSRLRQRYAARRRLTEPGPPSVADYGGQSDPGLWAATAPDTAQDAKAKDYRMAVQDLRNDAKKHQDRATRLLSNLLPHAWLWRHGGNHEQQFDFGVLRQRGLAREWRWEREFDDLHALARYTWGETLLSPNGGRLAGRILDWRSNAGP